MDNNEELETNANDAVGNRSKADASAGPNSALMHDHASDVAEYHIGDIAVFSHHVSTPSGTAPIDGLEWTLDNQTVITESISTTGIVLTIIFFWVFLLGLLFLLMREKTTTGFVEVTIRNADFHHVTRVPIGSASQLAELQDRVERASAST